MKRQITLRDSEGRARDLAQEARQRRALDMAARSPGEIIRPSPEDLDGVAVFDAQNRHEVFLYAHLMDHYPYPFGARAVYSLPVRSPFRANLAACPIAMAMTLRGGTFGMCAKVFVVSDCIDPEDFISHWDRSTKILDSGIVPVEKLTFLNQEHRFKGDTNFVYVGPGIT